jgi:hypothetical protein
VYRATTWALADTAVGAGGGGGGGDDGASLYRTDAFDDNRQQPEQRREIVRGARVVGVIPDVAGTWMGVHALRRLFRKLDTDRNGCVLQCVMFAFLCFVLFRCLVLCLL